MKIRFNLLAALLLTAVGIPASPAQAQTQAPDSGRLPLKMPILHRAPAFASWTIAFKYRDKTQPNARAEARVQADRINSLTVTKTGKTYHEQATWSSGRETESWIFESTYLRMTPDGKSIVPIPLPITASAPGADLPDIFDYSRSDFDGFQWLSLQNYKGVKKRQEVAVCQFEVGHVAAKEAAKSGTEAAGTGPAYGKLAFLTYQTQLPLYCDDGSVERTFTYNAPPSAPLTPPERFLKVLKNAREGQAYRRSRPSPP